MNRINKRHLLATVEKYGVKPTINDTRGVPYGQEWAYFNPETKEIELTALICLHEDQPASLDEWKYTYHNFIDKRWRDAHRRGEELPPSYFKRAIQITGSRIYPAGIEMGWTIREPGRTKTIIDHMKASVRNVKNGKRTIDEMRDHIEELQAGFRDAQGFAITCDLDSNDEYPEEF